MAKTGDRTRQLYRLAKEAKRFFRGYVVTAIDPGVVLTRYEKLDSGKSIASDTLYLSETAARCLVERKAPRRVYRRDM